MSRLFLRPVLRCHSQHRSVSSNEQVFKETDHVWLRNYLHPQKVTMTTQLCSTMKASTPHGYIKHSDIIGLSPRSIITTNSNVRYRATFPTLEQYVTKVPRLVTPIYPYDAATIVSHLDIHPDPWTSKPLEIFEAGTGHGSLTLALAKAMYAGNAHLSDPMTPADRLKRKSILHTMDISKKHSDHAQKVVAQFRRGMYADTVDYYVGEPGSWLDARFKDKGPFLYAVILDMPGPEKYFKAAARALLPDGIVCVFCPSITQIGATLKEVMSVDGEPDLFLEKVLEFPAGSGEGAGLRAWDVRYARVRQRAESGMTVAQAENRHGMDGAMTAVEGDEAKLYEMVCRPLVGERLMGGGFFGMYRKKGLEEMERKVKAVPVEEVPVGVVQKAFGLAHQSPFRAAMEKQKEMHKALIAEKTSELQKVLDMKAEDSERLEVTGELARVLEMKLKNPEKYESVVEKSEQEVLELEKTFAEREIQRKLDTEDAKLRKASREEKRRDELEAAEEGLRAKLAAIQEEMNGLQPTVEDVFTANESALKAVSLREMELLKELEAQKLAEGDVAAEADSAAEETPVEQVVELQQEVEPEKKMEDASAETDVTETRPSEGDAKPEGDRS